jgi:hypothetical protein
MKLVHILKESLEEQTELDEAGIKDVILGALMSLPFLNSAEAKSIADTVKVDAKDTTKIASAIKNTSSKDELTSVLKNGIFPIQRERITPPAGYKKLTPQHRKDWNRYLDYLESAGLQGSPELDKGVPTKGRIVFNNYLKENPNSSLNDFKDHDALVKSIQYEMKVLRKGIDGSSFDLTSDQLKAYQELLWKIRNKFMTARTSDSDGNPGQYTTMEYYPSFSGDFDYPANIQKVYDTLKK